MRSFFHCCVSRDDEKRSLQATSSFHSAREEPVSPTGSRGSLRPSRRPEWLQCLTGVGGTSAPSAAAREETVSPTGSRGSLKPIRSREWFQCLTGVGTSRNAVSDVDAAREYGVALGALRELAEEFPTSPPAELARYLARNSAQNSAKKAAPLLRAYLDWRTNELAHWPAPPPDMPMYLKFHGHARDGTRILHAVCTTIDPSFSPTAYMQAYAKVLDDFCPRESLMRITVLLDTYGHPGLVKNGSFFDIWKHALQLRVLTSDYFVERVTKLILYPADGPTMAIWNVSRHMLSPATTEKLTFLPGEPNKGRCPTPTALKEYFDPREIDVGSRQYFDGLYDDC